MQSPPLDPLVRGFILALATAAQRTAMYPSSHPILAELTSPLSEAADRMLPSRGGLTLTVAGRSLLVDDALHEEGNPGFQSLARRLRNRYLASVTLLPGLSRGELEVLVRTLADSSEDRDGTGSVTASPPPADSPFVRFRPLDYERLILGGGGGGGGGAEGGSEGEGVTAEYGREADPESGATPGQTAGPGAEAGGAGASPATRLWLELASEILALDPSDPRCSNPAEVARAIRTRLQAPGGAQSVLEQLSEIAAELKGLPDAEVARAVGERIATIFDELDEVDLRTLLQATPEMDERYRLIQQSRHLLGAKAFGKILRAGVGDPGTRISPALLRGLSKLSLHADAGAPAIRALADEAVRKAFEGLATGIREEDPTPARYVALLESIHLGNTVDGLGTQSLREDSVEAGFRVLEMALEVGAWGPVVADTMDDLLASGQLGRMIEHLEGASPDSEAARQIEARLVDPTALRALAHVESLDAASLTRLVSRAGTGAIDPLLDALAETEHRSTRRTLFDALRELGEPAAVRALERLDDDPRWFVVRNRLALAQGLEAVPDHFDPLAHLSHENPKVRLEVVSLASRQPALRTRALDAALGDSDPRVVAKALTEAQKELPTTLIPVIRDRVLRADPSDALRVAAVRAIAISPSPLALPVLIESVSRRGWFGRVRLRPAEPSVLEALRAIAKRHSDAREARKVLELARVSGDPTIRAAIEGGN